MTHGTDDEEVRQALSALAEPGAEAPDRASGAIRIARRRRRVFRVWTGAVVLALAGVLVPTVVLQPWGHLDTGLAAPTALAPCPAHAPVVVFSRVPDDPHGGLRVQDIFAFDREGSVTRITTDSASLDPGLSPDGHRITFVHPELLASEEAGSNYGATRIAVMNSDGTQQRDITDGPSDEDPQWAPDGHTIRFLRPDPTTTIQRFDVMTVDVRTGQRTTVLRALPLQSSPSVAWSPDGSQIAYWAGPGTSERSGGLTITKTDGSGTREIRPSVPLTENGYGDVAFSPRGDQLAVVATQPAAINPEIWTVAVADGQARRIVAPHRATYIRSVDWPLEGHLVYAVERHFHVETSEFVDVKTTDGTATVLVDQPHLVDLFTKVDVRSCR